MLHFILKLLSSCISRNKLVILNFHQVLENNDVLRPGEPNKEKFDWQMALLKTYYKPMSISYALNLLGQGKLPTNSVCITFDDGYLNNYTVALPLLKKHNIPATVFVASAFSHGENMWNDRIIDLFASFKGEEIDLSAAGLGKVVIKEHEIKYQTAWQTVLALKYFPINDRLSKVKQLYQDNGNIHETRKMMLPEEILAMSEAGIEIASHTHNHPIIKDLTEKELLAEILTNKNLLEQWTGKAVTGFAYPNGKTGIDFNEKAFNVLATLGIKYAVTTQWGFSTPTSEQYTLKRFTPWDDKPWKFHLRMLLNLIRNK